MPRKKNEEVWAHFTKKIGGAECNYCKQVYKSENVTKMRKHLLSCFHCPENIKAKLDRNSMVDTNLTEKLSEALEIATNDMELSSAASTPQSSRPSTPNTSRASTPSYSRAMTPFVDRMSDKENVCFALFFCNVMSNSYFKLIIQYNSFSG